MSRPTANPSPAFLVVATCDRLTVVQGCGSRDLVLVSRPIKTTFLRSWSWSQRVVLSKTWGYVQPQRYLCRKSKLASECAPLFIYLFFDRPIWMFLCIITFTAVQYSNVDEWKLFVCAGRDQDSKGLGLGLGLSGLGLGLPGLDNISAVVISTSHVWNLFRTEDVHLHTPAVQTGTHFLLTLETIIFHLLSATSKPFSSLYICILG